MLDGRKVGVGVVVVVVVADCGWEEGTVGIVQISACS